MTSPRLTIALLLLANSLGCATSSTLPDHHLPRGFSSSYYRYLQGTTTSAALTPATPTLAAPEMESQGTPLPRVPTHLIPPTE